MVRDLALKLELVLDAWFGPAAAAEVEEEKRDPAVGA